MKLQKKTHVNLTWDFFINPVGDRRLDPVGFFLAAATLAQNLGGPKKICKNFNFFLKKKMKNLGVPKKSEEIPDFLKKIEKNLGYPKNLSKIPDFLKIREKNQGVPKIPETADHNV